MRMPSSRAFLAIGAIARGLPFSAGAQPNETVKTNIAVQINRVLL